jgi:hypothetical protein
MDQEDARAFAQAGAAWERGRLPLAPSADLYDLVAGQPEAVAPPVARGLPGPASAPVARQALLAAVDDAMDLIPSRAGVVGQSALGGLVGLGAAELAGAAGIVGLNIAAALGQAEKVTRLYALFRSTVANAVEALIALLGRPVLEAATNQALAWVSELEEGNRLRDILLRLYETVRTRGELREEIAASRAELEQVLAAIQDVDKLNSAFLQQVKLAENLLRGVRFLGAIAVAALPASSPVLAGVSLLVGVYIVLAGADYVDAPRFQLLSRVPGVRRVIEVRLAGV